MTLEACATFCAGYLYFGTEYARECYCGNSFNAGSVPAPATVCSFTCMGNALEYCGARLLLSVYSSSGVSPPLSSSSSSTSSTSSASSSASPTAAGPIQPATVNGNWHWYGCRTESTTGRALNAATFAADTMTLEACAAFCVGYLYFGTEYARECYCGNSFNAGSVPAPATSCSFTCMGNALEYCGARLLLSVYSSSGVSPPLSSSSSSTSSTSSVSSSPSPTPAGPIQPATVNGNWHWYGCQTEATSTRALNGATFAADTMTLEACASFCVGYLYFGTEYARECYCGNSFNAGSVSAPATSCSFTCMGNALEYCGARLLLSVYSSH